MPRLRARHLTRCTAIALVAILAGQLAVAGHAAAADHELGEQCDVCVSGDRLAHGLSGTPAAAPVIPAAPAVLPPAVGRYSEVPPRYGNARAPPRL